MIPDTTHKKLVHVIKNLIFTHKHMPDGTLAMSIKLPWLLGIIVCSGREHEGTARTREGGIVVGS